MKNQNESLVTPALKSIDYNSSTSLLKYGLIVLFFIAYVVLLIVRPLFVPDEVRYGEIAREMIATGNWIVPRLNGLLYFEKPPMGHWLNAIALMLFGENPFAVRIMSALSTGLVAISVYLMARVASVDKTTSLSAAFIYLTTLEVYGVGTFSVLDSMFTVFLNIGIVIYYVAATRTNGTRRFFLLVLTGVVLGFAFLTKGFLALVLPGLILGTWLLWTRQFRLSFYSLLVVGMSLAMTVAPWAWKIHQLQPDFWRYFIWVEHIQRFAAENAQHKQPFLYFFAILPILAFPWLTLVPAAIRGFARSDVKKDSSGFFLFLALWLAMPLLFFSISSGKLLTYILPCFAPFAILVSVGIQSYLRNGNDRLVKIGLYVNSAFLFVAAAAVGIAQYGVEGYQLYPNDETIKFSLLVSCLTLAAMLLVFLSSRPVTRSAFIGNGLVAITLLACTNGLLPQSVYDAKAPGKLLNRVKMTLEDDDIVIAHGSLVRAASWYLQRDDIYLYSHTGELDYGVTADGGLRFKNKEEIVPFLRASRQDRDVVIICKYQCSDGILETMPEDAEHWADGKFFAYRIPGSRE